MKSIQVVLSEISQYGTTLTYELDSDIYSALRPGQYLLARGENDILPVPLFPCGMNAAQLTGFPLLENHLQPGTLLNIRFPLGKGFSLPVNVRRLLMVSGTVSPLRLFPVAGQVLSAGGEIALFTEIMPVRIPVEMELIDREHLAEAAAWADFIIGDTSLAGLAAWKELAGGGQSIPGRQIQVLVDTPLLCAGMADCGVCSVKTHRGWKLACKDGPVFEFCELEV
jgi:NAD(P)H-flavin reductase